MSSPKLMDKDEQLQLCIQRFVSDTQSMINQFSELFIGELRRFADVCMEFSVSYRGIQEERQFLTAENKSLKDELDARTAEVDFLGKELREIREENDELIRKLECLNINSDGEISMINDSSRPRDYAVVNSMPAFPRRYSSAIGYEPPASSASHRTVSNDLNRSIEIELIPSTSKTQLLTPPVDFNIPNINSDEANSQATRSHSRDDISLYAHLFNDSNNQLGATLAVSPNLEARTPSLDEIREAKTMFNTKQQTLSTAVSSSAGTFYDCCSMSNFDLNDSNPKKLITVTDQIRQVFGTQSSGKSGTFTISPEVIVSSSPNDDNNCTVLDVNLKSLKTPHNETSKQLIIDQYGNFTSKSPSPNYDFNQHLDNYSFNANLQDLDEDAAFFIDAQPVCRINSKKISKKRKFHKKISESNSKPDETQNLNNNKQQTIENNFLPMPVSNDYVPIIPPPQVDLNRYLLVEVCHIVSPSHFYLIVNDEKVGSNAFEDFLERFQNFYKSLEDIEQNSFNEFEDEERELRLLVSIPPPIQALTIGSYWACYIDEELDWRRIQIIGDNNGRKIGLDNTNIMEFVTVKDVDSGYSSVVHSQMIRPLTDEMARVPAFAIRASLAFIYPHLNMNGDLNSKDHINEFYDHWQMECCEFFEDITYDQILTASVLQINGEDLTETEVAQVLLWCTSAEDYEIFINRKMIELNYASNIADDDSWMEQFNEVVQQSDPQENNNAQSKVPEATVSVSFQVKQQQSCSSQQNGLVKSVENADKNTISDININNDQQRKIKIKTRSKKKKGSLNEIKEEKREFQPEITATIVAQNELLENKIEIVENPPPQMDPNSLLQLPSEPKIQLCSIMRENMKNNNTDNLKEDNAIKPILFDQYCQALHHDPRLSNWIIQKHSRHVTLRKCFKDKIYYLFRITCYFEPNKFIGILPFGERKLDLDLMQPFIQTDSDQSNVQSPFKMLVKEMTEFYLNQTNSSLRLLPEQCVFEQANSSTIVFYDSLSGLFLRGHIVGKDMSFKEEELHNEQHWKSAKDLLKVPDTLQQSKKKSLSLKRRSVHDTNTMYIIYAIDAGRYYQAPLKHIYHLDDRFKMAKPFAIVCKLHGFPNCNESSNKLRKLIEMEKFLGLRFVDIDFSTERFAVELYSLNIDNNNNVLDSSQSNKPIITKNINSLI